MLVQVLMVFIVLLTIVAMMSVGVIFGRKPIKGSCGGIGAALGQDDYECEFCGGDPNQCDSLSEGERAPATADASLAYEVAGQDRDSSRR